MSRTMRIILLVLFGFPAMANNTNWPLILTDPAAIRDPGGEADLLLPMPCGGAMAFQRVDVPVDVSRPLDDYSFRMGQSDRTEAYSDYFRSTRLRGAFDDVRADVSYYFIGRYELNEAQYRAIREREVCSTPFKPIEAKAKGNLSWFDAVELSKLYTEWLMANARGSLPAGDERIAFVRLPTEPEWEYAVRGGNRVTESEFAARLFFSSGSLSEYAVFRAPGVNFGGLGVIGKRKPNALGLYDVYGNAEEMMLEPYRLNVAGRNHGQQGGLITRGGAGDLEESGIYTARRVEYSMFNPDSSDGSARAGEYFGVRFVLSANIVSDDRIDNIRENWEDEDSRPLVAENDPLESLEMLLEDESNESMRDVLDTIRFELVTARGEITESSDEAAKSLFLSGAVLTQVLQANSDRIANSELERDENLDYLRIVTETEGVLRKQKKRELAERLTRLQTAHASYIEAYRSALESLSNNFDGETLDRAYGKLRRDLRSFRNHERLLELLGCFTSTLTEFSNAQDMSEADLLQTIRLQRRIECPA